MSQQQNGSNINGNVENKTQRADAVKATPAGKIKRYFSGKKKSEKLSAVSGKSKHVITEKEKGLTIEEINLRRKRIRQRNIMYVAVIGTTVAAIIGYFVYTGNLRLKGVKAQCNGTCPYSEEQLLTGLGLEEKQHINSINKKELEKKAAYELPYLENVKLSTDLRGFLNVKADVRKPMYYTVIGSNLYILSDKLIVLENTEDIEKIEQNNLKLLVFSEIYECVEGKTLAADEDEMQIVLDLETHLKNAKMLDKITEINISNKYEITMNCGTEYLVKLGDASKLEFKINFFASTYAGGFRNSGIIDVSDTKEGKVGDFK